MLTSSYPSARLAARFVKANVAPLALIALMSWAAPAAADGSDVVRPSTRPMFATGGIGPSFGITGCGNGGCASTATFTQFQITEEFGYHISGSGDGFALGASVSEAFGNSAVRLAPGFKMWWDIQPVDDLGLYIAPSLKLGYALFTGSGRAVHTFNSDVGVAARLVLADRGMVYFRPVTLAMFANGDYVLLNYEIMAGGGVTF